MPGRRSQSLGEQALSVIHRRGAVALTLSAVAAGVLPRATAAAARHDAVVSLRGGAGRYPTLAAALTAAHASSASSFRIHLDAGTYTEKVTIDRPGTMLSGEGDASVLVYGAAAGHVAPDGRPWGTGRTATLTIAAPDVTLRDLTIRNGFDYLANRTAPSPLNGAQAVALMLAAGADRVTVADCAIEGYQDTLNVREGHALFERCRIVGGVDFIFGGAAARFDRCRIVSRAVPGPVAGYVAAPSTPAAQPAGLVFTDCRLEREAGLADDTVYLGRPWRAGGNMALTGSATFVRCWMDRHIKREGWTAMGYTAPDGQRTMLTPQEARLAECDSRGPGAAPASPTRRRIDAAAAGRLVAETHFTPRRLRG